MATKEDILEQLVEEYLLHRGYFVRHNIKFRPRKDHPDFVSNQDSNHSDIDVLGYNPRLKGPNRIWVVNCKSWQGGFNPKVELRNIKSDKKVRGKKGWKFFRELSNPKWSEAFVQAIMDATGSRQFTYILACTKVVGEKQTWESDPDFVNALGGNSLRIIQFGEMLKEIYTALGTTLAGTEVGRMLQLFKAVGIDVGTETTPSMTKRSVTSVE